MDLHHQSHFSSFSRFSDMLKDTTGRRSKSVSQHPTRNSSSSNLAQEAEAYALRLIKEAEMSKDGGHKDSRRSSIGNYADRVRQMFTPSHSASHHKKGINNLPTEVLQHVFNHLEFWELVRCQRVCKTWHDLVPGDSPLLSETLYLKPSRSLQIYNLVPTTFDFEFDISPQSIESGPQPSGTRFSTGVRNQISMMRRCLGLIRTSQEIVFHPVIMDFNTWIADGALAGKKHGSWRRMLVSMPPLRELTLRHGKNRSVVKVLKAAEGDEGVRLGDLFDCMDDWMKRLI